MSCRAALLLACFFVPAAFAGDDRAVLDARFGAPDAEITTEDCELGVFDHGQRRVSDAPESQEIVAWDVDGVRSFAAYFVEGEARMVSFDIDSTAITRDYVDDDMILYGSSVPGWSLTAITDTLALLGWRVRLGGLANCEPGTILGGRVHRTLAFERGVASVSESNVAFDPAGDECLSPMYRRYTISLVDVRNGRVAEKIEPRVLEIPSHWPEDVKDELSIPTHEDYPRVRVDMDVIAVEAEDFDWIQIGDPFSYGVDGCGRIWWPWPETPEVTARPADSAGAE